MNRRTPKKKPVAQCDRFHRIKFGGELLAGAAGAARATGAARAARATGAARAALLGRRVAAAADHCCHEAGDANECEEFLHCDAILSKKTKLSENHGVRWKPTRRIAR